MSTLIAFFLAVCLAAGPVSARAARRSWWRLEYLYRRRLLRRALQ